MESFHDLVLLCSLASYSPGFAGSCRDICRTHELFHDAIL